MMTSSWRVIGAALLMMGCAAPQAYAQFENKLAVGLKATGRIADSSKTDGAVDIGIEWRWQHDRPGWAPQMELFNWFDTGLYISNDDIT